MRTVLGVAAGVLFTTSLQQELVPDVASPWHIGHVGPASAMPRAQTKSADTGGDRLRSIASDVTAIAARPERFRTDAAERIDGQCILIDDALRGVKSALASCTPRSASSMSMHCPSILSAASVLKRSGRAAMAVTSLAMLLSLSPPVSADFVCARGMAEAGPTCPMCHGDATSGTNSCCKLVVKSTPAATPSTVRIDDGRANDRV